MAHLLSASRIGLAELCIGSACLPRSSRETEAMALGTAVHKFLEDACNFGVDEALALVEDPGVRDLCERINPNRIKYLADGQAELLFGYDPETDMAGWTRDGIEALGDWPVIAKMDLVVESGECPYVADYKTGRSTPDAAEDSRQLRFSCLIAAKAFRATRATGEIIHISPTGYVEPTTVDLLELDLELARAELRALLAKVKAGREEVAAGRPEALLKAGSWCDRCPAFSYCPQQTKLVRVLAGDPDAIAGKVIGMLTPETASIAYERWKAIRAATNRIGEALHAYASQEDIQLGDGKVYGVKRGTKKELDGMTAHTVLKDKYGPDVAMAAVSLEASQASVERALKAEGVVVAPAMREFLKKLEEAGGLIRKETSSITEWKP